MNFLPNWYISLKAKRLNLLYNILIFSIILVDIFLFTKYNINKSRTNNLQNKIKCQNQIESNKVKEINKDKLDKTYNTLLHFLNIKLNSKNKVHLDNLLIKSNNIDITASVNNMDDYFYLIKCIEKNSSYNILDLTLPKDEGDYYKFNIIMEVK